MSHKTKEQLLELSADYFKSHKDVPHFHATPDGLFFLPNARGEAAGHQKSLGVAGDPVVITRDESKSFHAKAAIKAARQEKINKIKGSIKNTDGSPSDSSSEDDLPEGNEGAEGDSEVQSENASDPSTENIPNS